MKIKKMKNNELFKKFKQYFHLEQQILRIILKKEFLHILKKENNVEIFQDDKLNIKNILDFIIKNLKENNKLTNIYYFSLIIPKETVLYLFKNQVKNIELKTLFFLNEVYIEFPEKEQNKLKIIFNENEINEFYLQTNNFKNIEISLKKIKMKKFKLVEDNKNKSFLNNQLNLVNVENEVILEGLNKYNIILNNNIKKLSLYETQNLNFKNNKIKYLEELNYIKHLVMKTDILLLKNLIKKIDKIDKFYLNSYLGIEYEKPVIDKLLNFLIEKKIEYINICNLKFGKNLKQIENIETLKFHGMDITDTNLYIKNINNLLLDNNKLNNNFCFLENINKCEIYISTLNDLKYYNFKNLKILSLGLYIDNLIKLKKLFENIYKYTNNYNNIEKFEIKNFNIEKYSGMLDKTLFIINDFFVHKNKKKFKKEVLNLYISNAKEITSDIIPYFIHKEYFEIINKKLVICKI